MYAPSVRGNLTCPPLLRQDAPGLAAGGLVVVRLRQGFTPHLGKLFNKGAGMTKEYDCVRRSAMDLLDDYGPASPQLLEFLDRHGEVYPLLVAYVQRAVAMRVEDEKYKRSRVPAKQG